MLRGMLVGLVGEKGKRSVKAWLSGLRGWVARRFHRYDAGALKSQLKKMGVSDTDTLLVHGNFEANSGFRGTPSDLVEAFIDLVGHKGNLIMMSIPFRGSAYDYLEKNKPFYLNRTISMMGLMTEMLRRRPGTLRSLHPTHPVLAFGKDSRWIVEDHDKCLFPCGVGTPFDKLRQLKGKILFFDVGFGAITFFHFVEDLIKGKLPFPVYEEKLFSVSVVDGKGECRQVQTYAFTRGISRDTAKVEQELRRQGKIGVGRVGNSRVLLVSAEDVVSVMIDMVDHGNWPYGSVG